MGNLVEVEVVEDMNDMIEYYTNDEYTKTHGYIKKIEDTNEKLVSENTIPAREIVKDISTTETNIDLTLAALAKVTSVKLMKFEKYLSKIEDELFSDETLATMDKTQLMSLYTQARMLKKDSFDQLKQIKKDIDFSNLEINIMSMNAKNSTETFSEDINEILDKVINSEDFIIKAKEIQKEEND